MSMISAQCDELRAMAESVGLEMPQAATLMMEAADTILSLRDRAQDLQAENAKLRELAKRMFDRVNYECRCCSIFCSDWDEDNECCVFTTLMRELGIEIPKEHK